MRVRRQERGEGKIGCVVTLALAIMAGATALRVVPVLFSNNEIADTASELASKAGILPRASLEAQLQSRAKELGIPEALAKGAMEIRITGDSQSGACTIHLKYSRKVDLYGVYVLTLDTDKTVMKPFMDVR